MAGVTGTAQIDQAVRKYLAESRYTLQERPGVIKSSIRNENLPENQGPSVNIPKFSQVTTYALTEGVDMTQAQQITDTGMVITPAEFGAQVVLTDLNLMQAKDEFFRVSGRILGESFDRQQDQTLADDFDSFSVQIGAAADIPQIGHVMAAEAAIRGQTPAAGTAGRGGEPGPYPITATITPAQAHHIRKTLSLVPVGCNDPHLGDRQSVMGDVSGKFRVPGLNVQFQTDVNINKDACDDAKAGIYSKEASILVTHGPAASAERERDASLRGWEINFVGRWARGEYNDGWGREYITCAQNPTS